MKLVSSSIDITAPPTQVWQILTDFAAYPQWNPFIRSISGPLKVGKKLSVSIQPPGGKAMRFKPTVLAAEQNRELRWSGRLLLPGIFDGDHSFKLTATATGTRFNHQERFSGILVWLMGSASSEQIRSGFVSMNEALKRRVEG